MDNLFINAGIIALIYILIKFGEMRVILKENKPLKEITKDTIIVFICAVLGALIIDQIIPKELTSEVTHAFIDAPGF
jgi:hypothetical protein